MFNEGANHLSVEKSFRIKQDDKFFSRLMSKETSMANTSSRVFYYGETSVAVPFVWEAQPGTPKHPLSETSLPPLTPPPSYYTNSKSNHKRRRSSKGSNIFNFSCILPRFVVAGGWSRKTTTHMSPSSSWSSSSVSSTSSSSSSWSLVYPSSLSSIRDNDHHQGNLSFSQLSSKHKTSSGFIRGCYPFGGEYEECNFKP